MTIEEPILIGSLFRYTEDDKIIISVFRKIGYRYKKLAIGLTFDLKDLSITSDNGKHIGKIVVKEI